MHPISASVRAYFSMPLIMGPVPHPPAAASEFFPCRAKTSMERPNETPRFRAGIEVSEAWMRTGTRSCNDGSSLLTTTPARSVTSMLIREVPAGWETTTPFEITRVLEEREGRVSLFPGMAQNKEPRALWSIKAREDNAPPYASFKVPPRLTTPMLKKLRSPAPPRLLQGHSSKVGPFDFDSARSRVRGESRAHQALLQLCPLPRLQLPLIPGRRLPWMISSSIPRRM